MFRQSDLPLRIPADVEFDGDPAGWLRVIDRDNNNFMRRDVGLGRYAGLALATRLVSLPRRLARKSPDGRSAARPPLQIPWLPLWPGLAAKPLHDRQDYPWARILEEASGDIRRELGQVLDMFSQTYYQSKEKGEKSWQTYFFYHRGRANEEHLAACPRTAAVLAELPHNGFHICFSRLEPGGTLTPHTGPTNASLTAHLGLVACGNSTLWVGGESASYRDDEVLVFDDSYVHWARNNGAENRYTLMCTIWHPDLSASERRFLSWAIRE